VALLCIDNRKDEEAAALVDQVRKTNPVDREVIKTLSKALEILERGSSMVAWKY
jgi:hypothetical protein